MRKCDVIVPIYNAYDCVIACVDSVLKNTDFSNAHLILIDDKSPDERIRPLLDKYQKDNPSKITVIKNEKNLGFVGTVNKGMKTSKNDVLLLNSDTEVPEKWLEKIQECAYSDEYIATVTPLSNNATLASVPKMFERNELPEGYNLEEMDKLVERCSMRLYPEIPTAHGFCMFIKREALTKVGYFDEDNFGKGYGEENDFSFRCFKYGYRNVLCDTTYILHKESQSFLDSKKLHNEELERKHPVIKGQLDLWNRIRDIEKIGANIELARGIDGERPNILVLIHDFSNLDKNLGGTTLHVLDVINGLRDKYNFHVLTPSNGYYEIHSFFEKSDTITAAYEKPIVAEGTQFYSNDYKRMVEDIIENFKISFVHVHHLKEHCYDIMNVCNEKGIKYTVSLHDYYLIEATTGIIEKEIGSYENPITDVEEWQKNAKKLLSGAVKVISPSKYVKDVFSRIYSLNNIEVIEHGRGLERIQKDWETTQKKNIAFIGVMAPHKGADILDALIRKAPSNTKIHLFGVKPTGIKRSRNFVNHGEYKREELPELIKKNKIDAVCILSLWPETYSYTATEAIACGVPVIALNIGAINERIEENNIGFAIPYTTDAKQISRKIQEFLNDEGKYNDVVESINSYHIKTTEEMNCEYDKLYDKYSTKSKLDYKLIREKMLEYHWLNDMIKRNNDLRRGSFKKALVIGCLRRTKIGRAILDPNTKLGQMARRSKISRKMRKTVNE